MNGFEIKFRGKTVNIAPEFGSMGVLIHNRNGHYHIDASGLIGDVYSRWIDTDMELGERVKIEVKRIDLSSEPAERAIIFPNPPAALTEKEIEEMNFERLDYFYALEKMLKGENLLQFKKKGLLKRC